MSLARLITVSAVCVMILASALPVWAYPLDATGQTGIRRLEGYLFSLETDSGRRNIVPGARLKSQDIRLRLLNTPFSLPSPDRVFTQEIRSVLGSEADRYAVAVLDLSAPGHPLYAEHNGTRLFGPGSVGKIVVGLGLFQTLADIFPQDIEARRALLRDGLVNADSFILSDTHEVPFWHREQGAIEFRPLEIGDSANLWSYLDFMLSASSNAAASMVLREILLLLRFRSDYPPSPPERETFFRNTSPAELQKMLVSSLKGAVQRNGLDPGALRQGSFFTREGKKRVEPAGSHASARELMRFLVLMEQGRLVDEFSSLELKKLLYLTQKRIRYASSPALSSSAVYYKSGSMYRCGAERGFVCKKYCGNLDNTMNSIAIVEHPAENPRLFYMVVLSSNVLRKDSSEEHRGLALRIHQLVESRSKDTENKGH